MMQGESKGWRRWETEKRTGIECCGKEGGGGRKEEKRCDMNEIRGSGDERGWSILERKKSWTGLRGKANMDRREDERRIQVLLETEEDKHGDKKKKRDKKARRRRKGDYKSYGGRKCK